MQHSHSCCRLVYSSLRNVTDIACASRRVRALKRISLRTFCAKAHTGEQKGIQRSLTITTPIFYVNAAPHIGHLYTAVVADAANRWFRLQGCDTLFTTGTDEHGLKIQQAASATGKSFQVYCDDVSRTFQNLFDTANISYIDYIRTTEDRHKDAVQNFWVFLQEKGFIYKGIYENWYSVSDEEFLTEKEVEDRMDKNGNKQKVSITSGQPVTWIREENYMFKLSLFKSQLHEWLDKKVIHPETFEPAVRSWLENLQDLSVSRSRERLSWGIPVPGDSSQTIYVWMDALINYLTVCGYPNSLHHWPPDYQVIGKDILKFHAIYWPAFLMAAELQPPKCIVCHSHWKIDDQKMSKSRGNVVDPIQKMKEFSVDGLRYFLLRGGVLHSDCNYTEKRAVEMINSELISVCLNLLSRSTSAKVNPQNMLPSTSAEVFTEKVSSEDREVFNNLSSLADMVDECYTDFNFNKAIECIINQLRWGNQFMQKHKPWELAKNTHDQEHLHCVLHVILETLRICGILLQPVIPDLAGKLLQRLNVPQNERLVRHAKIRPLSMSNSLENSHEQLLQRIK